VPKLVGEKKTKTQTDDIQSMSASVFFVLYPTLADYIVSVLKDAHRRMNCSDSQISASERSFDAGEDLPTVEDASRTVDVAETRVNLEHSSPVVTNPLLFPVLSLLCRLSPGLEVTEDSRKYAHYLWFFGLMANMSVF